MIKVNNRQLNKIIEYLNNCYTLTEFDFYSSSPGKIFPEKKYNWVVDYFFTSTLQQFGFWFDKNKKYAKPMYCLIDGLELKGSDYFWYQTNKIYINNPESLSLRNLSKMTVKYFKDLYKDDTGTCEIPMIDERVKLWKKYANDMIDLNMTPEIIVQRSNKTKQPINHLIKILKKISGYKEDPLLKKAYLLAMILSIRPEKFLISKLKNLKPIVDYHIQRSMLRMGIVEISDLKLYNKVSNRQILKKDEEEEIRKECFNCLNTLLKKTNKTLPELDYFFFLNRVNCPEMKEPVCSRCINNSICLKKKELFQPVIRTTYY